MTQKNGLERGHGGKRKKTKSLGHLPLLFPQPSPPRSGSGTWAFPVLKTTLSGRGAKMFLEENWLQQSQECRIPLGHLIEYGHSFVIQNPKGPMNDTISWINVNIECKSAFQGLWDSLIAQLVKNPPAMRETCVQSLGWEDPLEKGMATHSSILAWRIPWTV